MELSYQTEDNAMKTAGTTFFTLAGVENFSASGMPLDSLQRIISHALRFYQHGFRFKRLFF